MDIKELYESVFHDGEEFSAYMTLKRCTFPVTIEDESGVIAMCLVFTRKLNKYASSSYGYRSGLAAFVSGVCVREDLRGQGFGKALMKKTIRACRDLGYLAIYLSPDKDRESFYAQFGFETVERGSHAPTRRSTTAHFVGKRIQQNRHDRAVVSHFINSCVKRDACFSYGTQEAKRLIDEANMMDGMYLSRDRAVAYALFVKDGDEIAWYIVPLQERERFVVSTTAYEKKAIFCRCDMFVSGDGEDAFMMRKHLQATKPNALIRKSHMFERF